VSGFRFADIMSADFVLFLRASVTDAYWYLETLLYSTFRFRSRFESFARSESKAYFKRFSPVVGIKNKEALESLIATFSRDGRAGRQLPSWEFETLEIGKLANVTKLETQP
jgi:hypothetical protein